MYLCVSDINDDRSKMILSWTCSKCGNVNQEILEGSTNDGRHKVYIGANWDGHDIESFCIECECALCKHMDNMEIEPL